MRQCGGAACHCFFNQFSDPSVFKYLDASLPEQALAEEKSLTSARPVEAEASSKVAAIVIGLAYLHTELVHSDAE